MTNKELTEALENKLKKTILKRRIIEVSILIIFIALAVVCYTIREVTKEVIFHEGTLIFPDWEEVNYNNNYVVGIVIGCVFAIYSFAFLLADLLASRYATTEANRNYVTVYRGILHGFVFVNGEEKDKITFGNVIETKLPDGVKIVVSFSRSVFIIAHVSYSDDTPSVDL